MRDLPAAAELLDAARQLLRDEVLPRLSADGRHAALMIGNALAIARRQLDDAGAAQREELASLEKILVADGAVTDTADLEERERLVELNRRMCRLIRSGRFDAPPLHDAIREHLLRSTHARVQQSNPKYLDKNYAGTLIIWDRMFGTFQAEEEEPVYGLTKPLNSLTYSRSCGPVSSHSLMSMRIRPAASTPS